MAVPVLQLTPAHQPAILKHFMALQDEDLRLRFGQRIKPEGIEKYVEGLDFMRDAVFGVFGDDLELAGVAHLALAQDGGTGELGVSVLPAQRGKGVGKALFARAAGHCRNFRVGTLFMHCLAENGAMMHIARTTGMRIARDAGEADAYLSLPPGDSVSLADEMMQTPLALFDFALKSQLKAARAYTTAVGEMQKVGEPVLPES